LKNRTIIGIICMVLAVAITFLISPVVNNLTSDTTRVIRLAKDVKQGSPITDEDIVKINNYAIKVSFADDETKREPLAIQPV